MRSASAVLTISAAGCLGNENEASLPDTVDPEMPPPSLGFPDAPWTMTVYTDFDCSICRDFHHELLPTAIENHVSQGEYRLQHRDVPVATDWSWRVASAARAVQVRYGNSAFFEYSLAIFHFQGEYTEARLANIANDVRIDGEMVRKAAHEETFRPVVERDLTEAERQGVTTPPAVRLDEDWFGGSNIDDGVVFAADILTEVETRI